MYVFACFFRGGGGAGLYCLFLWKRFGDLTQTAYSFWLYDLCDNYLELIKPVVGNKSEDDDAIMVRGGMCDGMKWNEMERIE